LVEYKKYPITLIISLFLLNGICFQGAHAQTPVIESHKQGYINWTTLAIIATGTGVPSEKFHGKPIGRKIAEDNALHRSFENLYLTVLHVQINNSVNTVAILKKNKQFQEHIQQMTEAAQVLKKEYLSDGTVEITVQMSLNGGFSQLALPDGIRYIEKIDTILTPNRFSSNQNNEQYKNYSGLIVDARGLQLTPCLAPLVLSENADQVYGPKYISRENAVQSGVCVYMNSMDAAVKHQRIGNSPFIAKGIGVDGTLSTNIVISNTESARFKSSVSHLTALKLCRVIIVIDPDGR